MKLLLFLRVNVEITISKHGHSQKKYYKSYINKDNYTTKSGAIPHFALGA